MLINKFQKVVTGSDRVLAINSRHCVFEFNEQDNTWAQIPAKALQDVGVGTDGYVYGVGRGNEVFRQAPNSTDWKKIKCKAKLTTVAAFDKSIAWGIDKKGYAYQWNGLTFSKVPCSRKLGRIAVNENNVNSFILP